MEDSTDWKRWSTTLSSHSASSLWARALTAASVVITRSSTPARFCFNTSMECSIDWRRAASLSIRPSGFFPKVEPVSRRCSSMALVIAEVRSDKTDTEVSKAWKRSNTATHEGPSVSSAVTPRSSEIMVSASREHASIASMLSNRSSTSVVFIKPATEVSRRCRRTDTSSYHAASCRPTRRTLDPLTERSCSSTDWPDFAREVSTAFNRSMTRASNWRTELSDTAATEDSIDCRRSGTPASDAVSERTSSGVFAVARDVSKATTRTARSVCVFLDASCCR
mmetsp:Transcript_64893/g.171759  ORF Transcript_64893/g.171759 Transcript_64893/m.171759 type:complete len:280 (-) Transcript_64893:770-1609(-)